MKKLKNISFFKIILIICLNILVQNKILLIISFIFLLIDNKYNFLLFTLIIIIISLFNSIKTDYIKIGIVEKINDNYLIVDKLLYKTKIYSKYEYNVGDILLFSNDSIINNNENEFKYNIKYVYDSDLIKISTLNIRKNINNYINSFDLKTSGYLKKIILNEQSYDEELENIGYGFCFYYLISLLKRKHKKISLLFIFTYSILFYFDIKFYILIIDIILNHFKLRNIDKLSIKIILLLIINKYFIYNYSIIISILLSFYYISELQYDKFYFAVFQSIMFNQIQIIHLFCFKYIMLFRIFMLLLSFLTLLVPITSNLYILLIESTNKILNIVNISIRGGINLIVLVIIVLLFKIFKIKNQYIKILLLIILLSGINNPFKHVTFINVGQGDSSLIKGEFNSYNVLIDTGSIYNYSKLRKELFKQGVYSLDYLIITHNDSDHSGNINNLINDFKINKIITLGEDIKLKNDTLTYINIGNYENDNDSSLIYLLNMNNIKFLFTGDVSKKVENRILDFDVNDIDVLKVSHHGSNSATSRYFVGKINPKFAVISTSGAYNHPSKEVIDVLDSYYVKTFITKNDGSITFYFSKYFNFIKTGLNEFVII